MNLTEMKTRLGELQTRREELKAKAAMTDAENAEYLDILAKQTKLIEDIKRAEAESAIDAVALKPQGTPASVVVGGPVAESAPYSMGEYLRDIMLNATRGEQPKRFANLQQRFKAAATGLNEGVPADGGFLVSTDMASEIMRRVYENGQLARRCSRVGISSGSNALTINGIDESSRADGSRHGGVRGYWEDEADALEASRPKFKQINLKLKKVTAAYYATDEVLADAQALTGLVNEAIADELAFQLDDAIIRGTGAGRPQGFLNSPALVTVDKQGGQPADSIVWENIRDMYARMWAGSRSSAIWIANDEALPPLMDMVKPVGTGGIAVWMPANVAVNQPYDSILGKPIVYPEQASALGDPGDISFVDLSQIQLIDKGGIQGASSIHVRFLQSEQVFRFVYRIDGQSKWSSALTPYKGSKTKSPFVTLATR
jgi:HK97 family phage major capsid protein